MGRQYILGVSCIGVLFLLSACNSWGGNSVPDIYNTSTSGQCQNNDGASSQPVDVTGS